MENIQTPQSLYFNGDASDTLDLNNFVDQMFNTTPVSQISVPLVTKTDEDIKFESKLSNNFDNLSTAGYESLMSMVSPSDNKVEIDLTSLQQGVYSVEETGYISFKIEEPVTNDYLMVKNSNNGMVMKDTAIVTTSDNDLLPLSVIMPVAKYQTVVFKYNSSTISIKEACLIPFGNSYNVGEALSDTRDYKALMANIGFPDVTNTITLGLPTSGSQDVTDTDGYYSICATLGDGDYITLSTESYGATIKYDGTNTKQYIFLPIQAQTLVTFEYQLISSTLDYIVFVQPVGKAGLNG